jgi:hypothetical protein
VIHYSKECGFTIGRSEGWFQQGTGGGSSKELMVVPVRNRGRFRQGTEGGSLLGAGKVLGMPILCLLGDVIN